MVFDNTVDYDFFSFSDGRLLNEGRSVENPCFVWAFPDKVVGGARIQEAIVTRLCPSTHVLPLPSSQAQRSNPGIHLDGPKRSFPSPESHRQ